MKRRKGTPEQVEAFDQADRELQALGRIREETTEYHRLNSLVNDLAEPLSRWQQSALVTGFRIDRADARDRRRRRYLETGKGFAVKRATGRFRSRLPVYRNRINPATGLPRRDDAEIGRRVDEAFARLRARGITPLGRPVKAQDYAPRGRAR